MHLIALHDSAGSSNPLGISSNVDKISMSPYYLFKDLITLFLFIIVLLYEHMQMNDFPHGWFSSDLSAIWKL